VKAFLLAVVIALSLMSIAALFASQWLWSVAFGVLAAALAFTLYVATHPRVGVRYAED
jgi:hypothetical protein